MSDFLFHHEIQKKGFSRFDMDDLERRLSHIDAKHPKFIHVGGPSAVGKTTLALILRSELSGSEIISIDSYLIRGLGRLAGTLSDTPPEDAPPYIGGITPDVWEFSLLKQHISDLLAGESIQVPIFDQSVKDRVGDTTLDPTERIILEGGNSFSEDLRETADYKIIVTASLHDRLVRKAVRTHARYGRDDLDDVWGRYLTKDEPSWRFYEDEFTGIADQVFYNPSDPVVDFAALPSARYARAKGISHKLVPAASTGTLRECEQLSITEVSRGTYQMNYAVGPRDLVNLPLDKQFVSLLEQHYDILTGSTDEEDK